MGIEAKNYFTMGRPSPQIEGEASLVATLEDANQKKDLSLGDLNPLIHAPDFGNKALMNALSFVAREKITQCGGFAPQRLETMYVFNAGSNTLLPRFVAHFEVDHLAEEQMVLLEQLVSEIYKASVRTRKGSGGKDIPPETYPPIHQGQEEISKTGGWYMGPNSAPTTSHHTGLFVFKDLGEVNKDNFFEEASAKSKYIVEVRESGLNQTDIVEFVTQVASVLGTGKLQDHGQLLYEIYYDLLRLNLKKIDEHSVYGLEYAFDQINKGLILPLANPDLSVGIVQESQSVLLIGVPGTGKTLIIERLLQEETGLFILPLDPLELQTELMKDKESQTLLTRIASVSQTTGRRVILHVDDIENMVTADEKTHATILNLMAGVRDSGFYVIASTNEPEKIHPSLLQPQRFGILIYFGLQGEQARYAILNIHATPESRRLRKHLFVSDQAREIILSELVRLTEDFTPRYLYDIATEAKSNLLGRMAKDKDKAVGLTEDDLDGYYFTLEDWEKAYIIVSSRYDKDRIKDRDKRLREFVEHHHKGHLGFNTDGREEGKVFSQEVRQRFSTIQQPPPLQK